MELKLLCIIILLCQVYHCQLQLLDTSPMKEKLGDFKEYIEELKKSSGIDSGASEESSSSSEESSSSSASGEEDTLLEILRNIHKVLKEQAEQTSKILSLIQENNEILKGTYTPTTLEPSIEIPKDSEEELEVTFHAVIGGPSNGIEFSFQEDNGWHIMKPYDIIKRGKLFPKEMHIELHQLEFIAEQNLGIRIGIRKDEVNFEKDDLAYGLHIRWNGDHYEFNGSDFDRKVNVHYRVNGEWHGPGNVDVDFPFRLNEKFTITISYEDSCYKTKISNERVHIDLIPMCYEPNNNSTNNIYLGLNADQKNIIPIKLKYITVEACCA